MSNNSKTDQVPRSKSEPRVIQIKLPSARVMADLSIPMSIVFTGILISASLLTAGNNIKDSFKNLNSGTAAQIQPSAQPPTAEPTTATVSLGSMSKLGNGQVGIVEFSDFECPFCSRFHTNAGKQIKETYLNTGKAEMYFRHLPLSFHPNARPLAEASACANEQGKFWEFHDKLFENASANGSVSVALGDKVAQEVGIDQGKYRECVDSKRLSSVVDKDNNDASSAGINGTPGFVIGKIKDGKIENGTIISGAQPFSEFQRVIDSYL